MFALLLECPAGDHSTLLSLDCHVLCFVLCHYFGSYHAIVGEKLKGKEKGWWTVTQNVGTTIFLRVIKIF